MTKVKFCIKESGENVNYFLIASSSQWTISKETNYIDKETNTNVTEPIGHYNKLQSALEKIQYMKIKAADAKTFKQLLKAIKDSHTWLEQQFGFKPIELGKEVKNEK